MADLWRGHPIVLVDETWVYADTGELVSAEPNRPCGHCERPNTSEGHDGCLGTLPGVHNACCGHGVDLEAFVQFDDGRELRGRDALAWAGGLLPEALLSAAIRVDGEVWTLPRPARHHVLTQAWCLAHWRDGEPGHLGDHEQGFMTDRGRFVERPEAERLAREAGQLSGALLGGVLTSEDLW